MGMRGQNVFSSGSRDGGIAHAELALGDMNARKFFADRVREAFFAYSSGLSSGALHDDGDGSVAADQFGERARGGLAGAVVVGCDEGDVIVNCQSRIEN